MVPEGGLVVNKGGGNEGGDVMSGLGEEKSHNNMAGDARQIAKYSQCTVGWC